MKLTRRDIFLAGGAIAAVGASTSLSACSPPRPVDDALPQNYFGMIATRKYDQATDMVSKNIRLSIVTTESQNIYAGGKNVTARISNLFHSEGFKMIGDTAEYSPGGMYWREIGPWLCSDMYKGDLLELENCGNDQLMSDVLNVYASRDYKSQKITQILLLQNRNFVIDEFERYRNF